MNYGNSVLGIRTNRNGAGMDLIQAMLGKAPLFGLMTDEGRKAKWLVEVKTSKEPDWGAIGTAIGRKCVEDVPYVTGLEKYFKGGKVTADNLHLLKAMGSATASSPARSASTMSKASRRMPRRKGESCWPKVMRPTSSTTRSRRGSSAPSRTSGRKRTAIPPPPSSAAPITPTTRSSSGENS